MHPGIRTWKNLVVYAFNAFSIPLLLRTLFSPFKMEKDSGHHHLLENAVFYIFSVCLGFVSRVIFIALGLVFTIAMILTFPIFFILPINISTETFQNLGSMGASLSYGDTYILNKHSRDLTLAKPETMYGKEKALRMIERGLSKDADHNVMLVGETGVGKTALIAHLARLGESGLSFAGVRNHRVVELIVEGITLDDFEKCLHEAAKAGNVIIVIENIHLYETLFDKLLPYLHSPRLGVVVTTDLYDYDRVLKNYPEFLSKFEKVDIDQPNKDEVFAILTDKAHELHMHVKPEALQEIVRLSERLIGNQPEPAKSLAILEELESLHKRIEVVDVQQVVSDKTNIPVGDMGMDERNVLVKLEESMRAKIVGQDEAVKDVSNALMRLRTGIADHSKPAGSFLFLGPTGVGKTYTAKVLAESYFGRKNSMIRFDMSEFSLADSITPFTERLTTAIEEAPLSLVFFDELEKSNVLIRNLMLQILDEGRLTRSSGREASFKEALIIATSNAGSADIVANPNVDKKILLNSLIEKGIYAPEFLNRFNDVVLFKPLDSVQEKKVATLLLEEFANRLMEDKKIKLEVTDALIEEVAKAGFDPEFGARPIKRAIEEIVENKVAEYIMAGNTGGTLRIM